MSDFLGSYRDRRSFRRAAVLVLLLLALVLVAFGGTLLPTETAAPRSVSTAVVGRTSTVCTVPSPASATPTPSTGTPPPSPSTPGSTPAPSTPVPSTPVPSTPGTPAASTPAPSTPAPSTPAPSTPVPSTPVPGTPTPGTPAPSTQVTPTPSATSTGEAVASTVSAVAIRNGAEGEGTLTGSVLPGTQADLEVTTSGAGDQLARAAGPVLLTGEGRMSSAGSGAVSSTATRGESTGLMAAPCLVAGTEQWLVGVGSTDADRTELILTNPDDAEAEVDLRFYGPNGRVVVPGSPGVVIAGRSSRDVSVSSLVDTPGPLTLAVRASAGRVSAAARRIRTDDLQPAGADWQVPSTTPSTTVLVPGVPGDQGTRVLHVVNPGPERTTVAVEVLGLTGAFVPAGAERVEVAAESTATVDLEPGLAGESGSVRLRSDTPVSGTVVATSSRAGAVPDLAVQPATPPLVRRGVSALATTTGSATSELVVSNGGDADAPVTFEVLSYQGVSLRRDDILLAAGGTATRRLTSPGPSYVVVTVPDESAVVGSVTLTVPEGPVAGLATVPLTSPDVAGRAPRVEQDPAVAR